MRRIPSPNKLYTTTNFGGRVYLETDNRWVYPHYDYGRLSANINLDAGKGVEPVLSWAAIGYGVKAGDRLCSVNIRGRVNSAQVTSVVLSFLLRRPVGEQMTSATSSFTTTEIYRTQLNPANNLTVIRHDETPNITFDHGGDLQIAWRPIGSLTARRFLHHALDVTLETDAP